MLTSHSLLRHAIATAAALALLVAAPVAHASKGSIEPGSFTSATFGAGTYAADLKFVGPEPCVLVGGGVSGGRPSAQFACNTKLSRRFRVVQGRSFSNPAAFDTTLEALYIAGADVASATSSSPILVRTDMSGRTSISYGGDGFAGAADLTTVAALGSSTQLNALDTDAEGSTVVVGDATANRDADGATLGFIAKVSPAGVLDASFGTNGVVQIAVPGRKRVHPMSVRMLDDGRILVVGHASANRGGSFRAFAAIVGPTGAFDPAFGGSGVVTPILGPGSTSFTSLPSSGGALPMYVAASSNVKGSVRPFVVRLGANGSVAGWGGPTSQTLTTMFGQASDILQVMDIETRADGSVIGAAEAEVNGEYDSFVSRFVPSSGKPDAAWASRGIEPIDTRPGKLDQEWSSAVALDSGGTPWIAGGSVVNGRSQLHLFRTIDRGSVRTAKPAEAGVFVRKGGDVLRCGSNVRSACSVARGAALPIIATLNGKPTGGSALVRPFLRIWSKAPGKAWKVSERSVPSFAFRNGVVADTTLRLGVGQHEVTVHRNGFATTGAAWSPPLHVVVR